MIKRESHNLSRSDTQQWSLGTGPGKCLLATTYESLQIKEDIVCPRWEGHLNAGVHVEVKKCWQAAHLQDIVHAPSVLILSARQPGPGMCGWKGSEPVVPLSCFP